MEDGTGKQKGWIWKTDRLEVWRGGLDDQKTQVEEKEEVWHIITGHIFQQSFILGVITDIIRNLIGLLYQSKK